MINAYIGKQQYFKSNLFSEPAALGSWDARKGHGQSTGQPRLIKSPNLFHFYLYFIVHCRQ